MASNYRAVRTPEGGTWYGPFTQPFLVRFWWIPLALLIIAAGLIFFNGIALLSPAFFAAWTSFLPWVAALGAFGFLLGMMLGVVLIGAMVLILLGYRTQATFLIFPTAIASLFIGGGFIAGIVIGVLAGMLILFSEHVSTPPRLV